MKRIFDIGVSAAGLAVLMPFLFLMGVLVKVQGRGPVFSFHKRIGKDLRIFVCYRFRTVDRDSNVTGIGRFLKTTGLDALPQLWNVLKGDMSIIGPRPDLRRYVTRFRKDYREVFRVRPGLLDISFLLAYREANVPAGSKDPDVFYMNMILPERVRFSREYSKNASFLYDAKLIVRSVFRLLYPYGAILKTIEGLSRFRFFIVLALQTGIFALSNYLAFYLRFDGEIPAPQFDSFLNFLPLLLLIRVLFLYAFSLNRGLWRYISLRDYFVIALSVTSGTVSFYLLLKVFWAHPAYPKSIFAMDWLLNIFLLIGIRLFRRLHERTGKAETYKKRVMVIGAGGAAELFLRDVAHSRNTNYSIIGLIDDDRKKTGLMIDNVPILGTRKDLDDIVRRESPEEFIIAIPSLSSIDMQNMIRDLRRFGLPIKTLPGLLEFINGRGALAGMKMVEPEDVLFRAPISYGDVDLKDFFKGKVVMVTGAGGSIGSELSQQVHSFNPGGLILFERHEESLYKIDRELKAKGGSPVHSIIGDILDEKRVADALARYRPHIVCHAAAYKHVPLMEENPGEAFKTNVLGTRIMAEMSAGHGVERFVLISTDKAVDPANVMGLTKMIAENVVLSLSAKAARTRYMTVRFGNVLGSSGSVVPLFKDQIKRGGPVTITHPDVTRYFMTIPEAVSLVLQAASMGGGSEVFVLDMGSPVNILELAKRMISLYGYRPGIDIEIAFTGLRPGEKLTEELFNTSETIKKTVHPKINMAIPRGARAGDWSTVMELARKHVQGEAVLDIMETLNKAISGLERGYGKVRQL